MSLTSHLMNPKSPISQFFRIQFPNSRRFLGPARKQIREGSPIFPDCDVPWGTIGTALDYRLRYYFAATPSDEFVAYEGARGLTDAQPVASSAQLDFTWTGNMNDAVTIFDRHTSKKVFTYFPEHNGGFVSARSGVSESLMSEAVAFGSRVVSGEIAKSDDGSALLKSEYKDFFSGLDALIEEIDPVARKLPQSQEDQLNRYCIVLALLEEVARVGLRPSSPLAKDKSCNTGELLSIAKCHWVDDLRELSWQFFGGNHHLLAHPHVLNPKFEGSSDIGGADADLIVDGKLIDIKTTKKREIKADWLWQLLGYVLLDYPGRYRINGIGLYMSRQGTLITWDLEEALRCLCSGEPPSIEELRDQFKELVQGL